MIARSVAVGVTVVEPLPAAPFTLAESRANRARFRLAVREEALARFPGAELGLIDVRVEARDDYSDGGRHRCEAVLVGTVEVRP